MRIIGSHTAYSYLVYTRLKKRCHVKTIPIDDETQRIYG